MENKIRSSCCWLGFSLLNAGLQPRGSFALDLMDKFTKGEAESTGPLATSVTSVTGVGCVRTSLGIAPAAAGCFQPLASASCKCRPFSSSDTQILQHKTLALQLIFF